MKTPKKVSSLVCEATCAGISLTQWEKLMKGHKRANKNRIDKLVKEHLPELYHSLALNLYNPYFYHKTAKHLILVHSGIEYFLRYDS